MEKNPYWGADGPRDVDAERLSVVLDILASLRQHAEATTASPAASVWQAFTDGLDDLRAETLDVLVAWQAEAALAARQSCAADARAWKRLRCGGRTASSQGWA